MTVKTKDLRRQLCKAVIDHISDSFLDAQFPILVLIDAAKSGDEKQVKEYAQVKLKINSGEIIVCFDLNILSLFKIDYFFALNGNWFI